MAITALLYGNWTTIPKLLGVDKCFFLGDSFFYDMLKKIKKPFWKSVLEFIVYMTSTISPKDIDGLYAIPLWFDSKMGDLMNVKWIKSWVFSDVRYFIRKSGDNQPTELEEKFALKTNLLEYGNL